MYHKPPPPPPKTVASVVEDNYEDRAVTLSREERDLLRFALADWKNKVAGVASTFMASAGIRDMVEAQRKDIDNLVGKLSKGVR